MDNVKNDFYFAGKIRDDLGFIVKHMSHVDSKEFARNDILQDSMMFRPIQISENARKLSEDYKRGHPSIPFMAMYGLRNRIVHDYGNVDLDIVFTTLKNDIPELFALMTEASNE